MLEQTESGEILLNRLPHILFDWWRGDSGILLDGEEMPGELDQEWARGLIASYSPAQVDSIVRFMIRRRWFFSLGVLSDDFEEWLTER